MSRFRARMAGRLRRAVSGISVLPLWLLALGVFLLLARGWVFNRGVARGFAEAIEMSVAPVEGGRLGHLSVALGQTVKAGDVVARMDDTWLAADLAVALADLETKRANAEAQRDELQSQVTRSGIWVMKARAGEQQDRAELDELSRRVERLQTLVDGQLAPRTELEDARQKQAALKARIAIYDGALKPRQGGDGRNILSLPRHTFEQAVEVRLQPSLTAIAEAEASVARLKLRQAALDLKAPFDGVVAVITHRPGEVLHAGDEVLRLVQLGTRITAFVPDRSMPSLEQGQHVTIVRPGVFELPRPGTLVELGGEVEQLPQRLWLAPHVPLFGRRLVFKLDRPEPLVPGEALDVQL